MAAHKYWRALALTAATPGTLEISEFHLYNGATRDTGDVVMRDLVERIVTEEFDALAGSVDDDARRLFVDCALGEEFPDFLTLQAYDVLLARGD